MLPVIHAYARGAFAHLNPEARQDMIQEVIANALVAYARLYQQGRVALAYPTVLARYGVAQVRDGRQRRGQAEHQGRAMQLLPEAEERRRRKARPFR